MNWIVYCSDKLNYVKSDQSFNTQLGKIDLSELKKIKSGDVLETSKGSKLRFIEPYFVDHYDRMKRGAQLINKKDAGTILSETMVGKDCVVLDCGSGMGGLTTFLARYVKKVYSMDNRLEHIDVAKKNAESLLLNNVEFIHGDIYDGIPVSKLNLIVLDIPSPDTVVNFAYDALSFGGFFIAYTPHANQMQLFVNKAKEKGFIHIKSLETIQRLWKIGEKILRPENMGLQHTGFLSILRKL